MQGPYDQFLLFGDSLTQQSCSQAAGFALTPALQDGTTTLHSPIFLLKHISIMSHTISHVLYLFLIIHCASSVHQTARCHQQGFLRTSTPISTRQTEPEKAENVGLQHRQRNTDSTGLHAHARAGTSQIHGTRFPSQHPSHMTQNAPNLPAPNSPSARPSSSAPTTPVCPEARRANTSPLPNISRISKPSSRIKASLRRNHD